MHTLQGKGVGGVVVGADGTAYVSTNTGVSAISPAGVVTTYEVPARGIVNGDVVVGADGLAYQHLGSIVISNPGGSVDATTRVMVIDPTNATSIVHTLEGKGVEGVITGPDGNAYVSTNTAVWKIGPAPATSSVL